MPEPLVDIRDLTVRFGGAKGVRAVNGVDLSVAPGETVVLLGESGSGKSVTLKALMRLLPERVTTIGGSIRVAGRDVLAMSQRDLANFRGGEVSMIFQDPGLAFDPVFSVGRQIEEAVIRHEGCDRRTARARALDMFERVRIPSPERRLEAYPHELSGGMRQRAMIALALATKPTLLLADEPTTALDATVQIQVLILLRELQKDLGVGVIFVTHDIGVAVEIADRVAVMYAGRIVETGRIHEIIREPRHPYTIGLFASRAGRAEKGERLTTIPGSPPDLAALPPGCAFAPRCAYAEDSCKQSQPEPVTLAPGHLARCFRTDATVGALSLAEA